MSSKCSNFDLQYIFYVFQRTLLRVQTVLLFSPLFLRDVLQRGFSQEKRKEASPIL